MTKEEKNYSFAMIAIVAIVAVVGLFVMFMQNGAGTSITTPATESLTAGDLSAEGNVAGEAGAIVTPSNLSCTDSDKGYNYYIKGTVIWKAGNKQLTNTDYCVNNILTEYGCVAGKSVSKVFNCPYGCSNGACINLTCTDSDGGKNYYAQGICTSPGATATDICLPDSQNPSIIRLNEKYCTSKGDCTNEIYICPNGCKDGACIPIVNCTESNSYYNHYIKGYVQLNQRHDDYCSGNSVMEYECGGNALWVHKNGFFYLAVNNQDVLLQYLGYNPTDSVITFQSENDTIAVSISDTMGELILSGRTYRVIISDKSDNAGITFIDSKDTFMFRFAYQCSYGCKDGACIKEPICGNGIVEEDETCDMNIQKCRDKFGNAGFQNCTDDCEWSDCFTQNVCGDGVLSTTEHCEGTNLRGRTCQSFGYTGGTLKCSSYCKFDTTACTGTIPCEAGKATSLVEFTLYASSSNNSLTDSLKDNEIKTYTMNGKDYEITVVSVNSADLSVKISVNGVLTKYLKTGEKEALSSEITIAVNEILTNSGTKETGRADFFLVDTSNGGSIIDYLRAEETKTYTLKGKDYEVKLVFIGSDENPSTAKLSVNGVLTKELKAGNIELLGGNVLVGIYNVMACTVENTTG